MNIFIIGQCTLHWGRMEFGNIGNYYIIEPFIRELHNTFPKANIKTTMQMSERFIKEENISVVPMSLYYGWTGKDLIDAKKELEIAKDFKKTGVLKEKTPYINEVLLADLVIDFSGDIWGDNANFIGEDRFMVGLLKDRVAQLLGKKIVMLAGSPGPFSNKETLRFAKEVFKGFDLVTNREPISFTLLEKNGFDTRKTKSLACPAFLFESAKDKITSQIVTKRNMKEESKLTVGFIICGWNFEKGPFDKKQRDNSEFIKFAEAIEYMTEVLRVRVCLMSHSNGFDIPPATFKLKHGRDYTIIKQLEKVLTERGISKGFFTLNDVYNTWETKAIIKQFDMLVSGRIHAAVASLSQSVPTVIIDYGHEPKAHKLIGFATVAQVQEYVADPCSPNDLKDKIYKCFSRISEYKSHLDKRIPEVKYQAKMNFELLKGIMSE